MQAVRLHAPSAGKIALEEAFTRAPGSGCAAFDGENRGHAVPGVSRRRISMHHGGFAQALAALTRRRRWHRI